MRSDDERSVSIREVRTDEAPALARLHVDTFIETHGGVRPPTATLREQQWRDTFKVRDGSWFCFVAQVSTGQLAGFAKGTRHDGGVPEFLGELNKIYVLRRYQRLGLGRRLVGHVARRFLEQDIDSMLLFGDAHNPSNQFYEALGAERLLSEKGEFHGGYGWRDLRRLVTICPVAQGPTEFLFSYGTLQLEAVQMATFGRQLNGTSDALPGFVQGLLEIPDQAVVASLGKTHHAIARFTGRTSDAVAGTVFAVTADEIQSADKYEVAPYERVAVVLRSGVHAWAYVDAQHAPPGS